MGKKINNETPKGSLATPKRGVEKIKNAPSPYAESMAQAAQARAERDSKEFASIGEESATPSVDNGMLHVADKPLTAKQKIFVMEYQRDGNGRRAAIAAGVPAESAADVASHWLSEKLFPHVAKAAKAAIAEMRQDCEIDAKRIVKELANIALFNPQELFDPDEQLKSIHDLPPHVARCIKKFEVSSRTGIGMDGEPIKVRTVKVELYDKLEAMNQAAKHLGLFKDVNITNQTVNVIDWRSIAGLSKQKPDDIVVEALEKDQQVASEAYLNSGKPALPSPPKDGITIINQPTEYTNPISGGKQDSDDEIRMALGMPSTTKDGGTRSTIEEANS